MFNVEYGPVTQEPSGQSYRSVTTFTITGQESLAVYSSEFTAGSAHDMGDREYVCSLIIHSARADLQLLDNAEEKSLRGLVSYLVTELCMKPDDSFDAAESLLALDLWWSKLTADERSHMQNLEPI